MRKVVIIVNPISGRGKAGLKADRLACLLSASGFGATVLSTTGRGSATAIAAEMSRRCDLFAVVGGDGTLNEVVNGMGSCRLPVAFLPAGTANVAAKEFRLAGSPEAVSGAIRSGNLRRIDVVRWNTRRFLMMAGAGFDAAVTQDLAARRRGAISMLSYVPSIARALRKYGFPRIRVEIDGRIVEEAATGVVVANMASYGGPFSITPSARPDDGLMDVCVMRPSGVPSLALVMAASVAGLLPMAPGVAYHRGTSATLSSQGRTPVQVDGDYAGELPARFEIERGALDLFVPEGK